MNSIHNITTKVFETEFWFGHYTVLLYDKQNYELYEMSRPMDRNWVCILLNYWNIEKKEFIKKHSRTIYNIEDFWKEISMEELMSKDNEDLRTAIKLKQEQFYPY